MKLFNITIILIATLLLNIIFFIAYLFFINSLWDGVIITLYLASTIGISFYIYLTIADIVKLHTLKGVLTNDTLLTAICDITTNLLFKYKNQHIVDLLSNITEHRFILKILITYIPISKLLTDDSLVICLEHDDKNTFSNILKTKITDEVNKIEPPYKNIYVLVGMNICSLLFYYFLLK